MSAVPKTLVLLTPAWPANESETSWVTTQQLFVASLLAQYPSLRIVLLSCYYPYQQSSYTWKGLEVWSFDGTKDRKIRRPFFYRRVWQRLRRIRRDNDVIGLLSFWCGECALLGHYFGKVYGIAHYCWLCGQDARAANRLVKFIRPRPSELIAMSDFLVREFESNHGIRPGHMIPNGIDPSAFPPLTGGERDIDILGVGSLSSLKRYDIFVDVIKVLKRQMPGIRAQHCGSGDERERLEAMISEAGLQDNVLLLGERGHGEALGLMQRSRLLLHTSSYEGFGVVCLEALYAGAQVISFTRPMDRDIPGWHIVGDPEEMIEKARELLHTVPAAGRHEPVLPYAMADSVKAVMRLYGL